MTLAASEFGALGVAMLIPLLPLSGAGLVGLLGPRARRSASHWPVILGVGGAMLCSLVLLGAVQGIAADDPAQFANSYKICSWITHSWIAPANRLSFDINFRIDPLTAIMLTMVCTVSLLTLLCSRDDMRGHLRRGGRRRPERGYERFFALMSLFVFSMCTLVLAGNFLLLYLGFEAVGLCSYLLIGFHYQRPAAAAAAKKAFLVNRIGDFGFALGILFIYLWLSPHVQTNEDPLDYQVAFRYITADALSQRQCTIIALLLLCGAVGKSAQLPLQVWLPDAAEAPPPVSALIHSVTTAAAGIYMVVRCGPIFAASPTAMAVVASIGAITALFAATIALAQYDIRRILAYSTISQLGYMFLGVGVFAADSAIFHLFTHAFFKPLLLLAAGSMTSAMGGITDVRQFGGLRRVLPVTSATFVIGALALAGFPLLSGFFSEGEIVRAGFAAHPILGLIGLATGALTAFYAFRMVFLALGGRERIPQGIQRHQAGKWMAASLVLLAAGAIGAGYVGVTFEDGGLAGFIKPHGPFHEFLEPVVVPLAGTAVPPQRGADQSVVPQLGGYGDYTLTCVSGALSMIGIALAYLLYARRRGWGEAVRNAAPQVCRLLHDGYCIDEVNDTLVVRPLRRTAALLHGMDRFIVDGVVRTVSMVPRAIGLALRKLQTGSLQGYGVTMAGGLVLIVLIVWLAG